MSEFRADSISPEDLERIPEPVEADWVELATTLEALNKHYQELMVGLPESKKEGWARRNFMDIAGNLIAPVDLTLKANKELTRTRDNYYASVKKLAALDKYLYLLDNFSDFKEKEIAESGMAFPEIDGKYRGHDEVLSRDGYRDYKEAYIYESAKLLEQTKNNQAA